MNTQLSNLSIDQLDRVRRRMLLGLLVGFVAWQLAGIIEDIWGDVLPRNLEPALLMAAVAGVVAFLYYGWRIVELSRLAKDDPAMNEALNDERVRWLRLRAFEAAFWMVVIYLAGVRLAALAYPLPGGAGPFMQLGLVVAVSSAILAYLWLDRESAA